MDSSHNKAVLPAKVSPFLLKTLEMLNSPAYSQYIRWSESGQLQIVDINGFAEHVLPLNFKVRVGVEGSVWHA